MINLNKMRTNLLVVTPQVSFGELIRQSVIEAGSYNVHVVKNFKDAGQVAQEELCTLALMDMELGEEVLLKVGQALRKKNPEINLIIMAEGELPPAMDSLRPWVLLRKPFYLPDFIQLIQTVPVIPEDLIEVLEEESFGEKQLSKEEDVVMAELPWLIDASKAAQHLTRLTLESSAQAALITRDQDLWAYAGQLSQDAAHELAQVVSRHWDAQKGNDLLRFVRLEATKAEHMLYATQMATNVVFALIFDAETPFSTIRGQAGNLAQSLTISNSVSVEPPKTDSVIPQPQNQLQKAIEEEEDDSYDSADDFEIPSIRDILNEIPPPIPTEFANTELKMESNEVSETAADVDFDQIGEATRLSSSSPKPDYQTTQVNSRPNQLRELDESPARKPEPVVDVDEELATTMPSRSLERRPTTPISPPVPGELEETRPHSTTERTGRMIVESASAAMAQLNYACLLLPRFTTHYLTGDIADQLSAWIPEICVAFGWRLEYLAVRPEYLQWVVNVMPNTSPGYVMRVMRLQTSEKIFNEFTRLKRENPSGDFWAPGYLIMSSLQPHPPQLVKDYIMQIRHRQGISPPQR
jgi:REP element-mobilizing transposase RayT/CheY-like chemotaxis protein